MPEDFMDFMSQFARRKQKEKFQVVKTVPMRQDWKDAWKKLQTINTSIRHAEKDLENAQRERRSRLRQFWAMVEADMKDYRDMQVDTETLEIKVFEEKDEKDMEMSSDL